MPKFIATLEVEIELSEFYWGLPKDKDPGEHLQELMDADAIWGLNQFNSVSVINMEELPPKPQGKSRKT